MQKIRVDLNKLLVLIAAGFGAIILLVTIIALIAGKRPGSNYRRADPTGVEQIKGAQNSNLKAFKEFGTLRVITLPEEYLTQEGQGAIVVLTPWLSYEGDDSAFYEELVSRKRLFTSLFLEYFSTKTKNALLSIGENQIKSDLLARFNAELHLGKLSAIYFDDYMFLD